MPKYDGKQNFQLPEYPLSGSKAMSVEKEYICLDQKCPIQFIDHRLHSPHLLCPVCVVLTIKQILALNCMPSKYNFLCWNCLFLSCNVGLDCHTFSVTHSLSHNISHNCHTISQCCEYPWHTHHVPCDTYCLNQQIRTIKKSLQSA